MTPTLYIPKREMEHIREQVKLAGYGIQSFVARKRGVSRQLVNLALINEDQTSLRSDIVEDIRYQITQEPFASKIRRFKELVDCLNKGKVVKLEKLRARRAKTLLDKIRRYGIPLKVIEVATDWPKSYIISKHV